MAISDLLNFLPTWLYFIIFLIVGVYLFGIWPFLRTRINLPGPKPKAYLGNMGEIGSTGVIQTDMRCAEKYGRVYLLWNGRFPAITVADPDMIKEILIKDFPNFTNRPTLVAISRIHRLMVQNIQDEHWKFVRSVITPAFSSGKMRGMVPIIQKCMDNLMDNMEVTCKAGKSFDPKPIMGAYTMDNIAATSFGIDTNSQKNPDDPLVKMAARPFSVNIFRSPLAVLSFFLPELIPVMEALNWTVDDHMSNEYFKEVVTRTIKERKTSASSRKDVLQLLMDSTLDDLQEAKSDGDVNFEMLRIKQLSRSRKLTDEEVVAQAVIFLLAGYETTASAMTFVAYNLAVNSECQDKLIAEIDKELNGDKPTYDNVMNLPYLEMCWSESHRLFPVAVDIRRMARNDTVIRGTFIPANTCVRFPVYAIHHDPEYWLEPEKFDPERFSPAERGKQNPYVFMPFGLGPRNCVGMRLAQLEAKMAFAAILQKYRFVRSPETEYPLKLGKGGFTRPENGILIKLESRV